MATGSNTFNRTTSESTSAQTKYAVAWFLCLIFYALEYASRSSPSVMIPELGNSFGVTAVGVGAVLGTYYYAYSLMSLVAGAALDWFGAKRVLPAGLVIFAVGCLLFLVPSLTLAYVGRLLQGAGSAFAFTGAVYLASRGLPSRWLGTAIGTTQCLGMAGGFAGTFLFGPMIERGMNWRLVWQGLGWASVGVAIVLLVATPRATRATNEGNSGASFLSPYLVVFRNPQSYFCGVISGVLFIPTTIGAMTWGVSFFEKDRGLSYSSAVTAASLVTMGWVIGCPILGWIADRLGRRKPVLFAGIVAMILLALQMILVPKMMGISLSCFLFGFASGVAMIPYSIIKEVNPDEVKGTATGAMNFMTFGVSALIGTVFGRLFGAGFLRSVEPTKHFQDSLWFWIGAIVVALLALIPLRETGKPYERA